MAEESPEDKASQAGASSEFILDRLEESVAEYENRLQSLREAQLVAEATISAQSESIREIFRVITKIQKEISAQE